MKTVRRVCSVILMLFGGLYAFGGIVGLWVDLTTRDADNRLEVFVIMLLMAAIGAGLLYLGIRLRPGKKVQ